MKTTNLNDRDQLERDFLAGRYHMHYSGGKKILTSPRKFWNEEVLLLGEKDKDSFLQAGKLTHALMLENESFKDKYVVSDIRLPSDNVKSVIDEVFANKVSDDLANHQGQVLGVMERIGYYAAMTDMDKKFAKVAGEGGKSYWDHLVKSTGKVLVDPVMFKECQDAAYLINAHPEATRLLIPQQGIYFNEMYWEMDHPLVGLAGTMDNIALDFTDNIVRVNDIKTSSKPLIAFPETVETYKYWLQACFYKRLALNFAESMGMENPRFEFHFIVSDVSNAVYCFPISDPTWDRWEDMFTDFWLRFGFHYNNRSWDVPMEFAKPGGFVL
jgi:hypothetical protein